MGNLKKGWGRVKCICVLDIGLEKPDFLNKLNIDMREKEEQKKL